jgi:hypothetical protein
VFTHIVTTRVRALVLVLLTGFPLLASAANPCAPAPRAPGTPLNAPHAAFEAYVVAVHAVNDARSPFGVQLARRALVEVVRSFHGPYNAGQQVETITLVGARSCGGFVEEGGHVMVVSESGGPFEIVEALPKTQAAPQGPFAAVAYAAGEPRRGLRPSLKNASLRGVIDAGLASELRARARTGKRDHCEIASDGNYAQVSWGKAFGGNDARFKVIFEHAYGGWVEILRYEAPAPTPARSRRSKQRALWATNGDIPHFPVTIGSSSAVGVDSCNCYREMRDVPISSQAPGRRIGSDDVVIPPFST